MRSRNNEINHLTIEIGSTDIQLRIKYNFIPGYPATGPSYSSGGEPADPDEIDFLSVQWAPVNRQGKAGVFSEVTGTLLDLIAEDEWIYNQICAFEESEHADHF